MHRLLIKSTKVKLLFASSPGSQPRSRRGVGVQKPCFEGERSEDEGGWGETGKHTNHGGRGRGCGGGRGARPTVAHSIQYSWKCDTLWLRWMALTLEAILSTSTGCSFHGIIEFLSEKKKKEKARRCQRECEGTRRAASEAGDSGTLICVPCLCY